MKRISWTLLLILCLVSSGCMTQVHTVGAGPTGTEVVRGRNWYLFFGLARLNGLDPERLAGEATSYRVTTEYTIWDGILNLIFFPLTIRTKSVWVEK
ncbi:MAG TPA: hypothetical protein ENK02_03060 [Planctomycetes bacterium]|nr:hypothetical protein [Planctomycetota bacterium]